LGGKDIELGDELKGDATRGVTLTEMKTSGEI